MLKGMSSPGVKRELNHTSSASLSSQQSKDAEGSGEKGIYKGGWKANKMHGFGLFKWATGRVYIGDWASDLKDGVGILTFKGGNEYAGEFKNDRRQGYGYYQWADNRKFKGWWHENKQHGLGVYFSPESTSARFGIWQMGKRIKWLNESECSEIRNGNVDYTNYFGTTHL